MKQVTGIYGSGYNPVTVFCEHGYQLLSSLNEGEFPDQMSDHQVLKNDFKWNVSINLAFSKYFEVTAKVLAQ